MTMGESGIVITVRLCNSPEQNCTIESIKNNSIQWGVIEERVSWLVEEEKEEEREE